MAITSVAVYLKSCRSDSD